MVQLELRILDFIQNIFSSNITDEILKFITHLGDAGVIWIIATVLLIAYPKTRKIGIICAISLLFSALITNLFLKNLIQRLRPFSYSDISLIIKTPHDYSFPSGHTSASFAFVFVLLKEKLKINKINVYKISIILATLIAFSRLYLYVHFPTDIIGGIIVGFICNIIAYKLFQILESNYILYTKKHID